MNNEAEIRAFMEQLCRKFGICDPLYDLEYFLHREYYEVDDLIREIFLAEGMNPELHLGLFRRVKREFIDRFGCSELYNPEN